MAGKISSGTRQKLSPGFPPPLYGGYAALLAHSGILGFIEGNNLPIFSAIGLHEELKDNQ